MLPKHFFTIKGHYSLGIFLLVLGYLGFVARQVELRRSLAADYAKPLLGSGLETALVDTPALKFRLELCVNLIGEYIF